MQNLLHQPKASFVKSISQVMSAIDKAAPIPLAHKRSLPHDIRDLSALLTEERGGMARPYWATKNFFSAYIHYFLPWNLYRLGWLLPSLPMRLEAHSTVVDLGSGPLTLPLALWCARPELRGLPLRFTCTDIATQPMEQGLAIFDTLTKGHSPWDIACVKAPIETAIAKLPGRVDCIMGANVLNELQPAKGQTLNDRITAIVSACSRKLEKEGTLFFVEPGTRLGGKVIIMAREAGRMLGLPIVAPCSHQEHCPLAKGMERDDQGERLQRPRGRQIASQTNMWCHFSFPVEGAPARLSRLTAAAKFDRRSLALSCVMMTAGETEISVKDAALLTEMDDLEALYAETIQQDRRMENAHMPEGPMGAETAETIRFAKTGEGRFCEDLPEPPLWSRIISGPIRLPKETLPARYGCSAAGLVLVRRCERIPYGAAVEITWDKLRRDEKSGALLVDMVMPEQSTRETDVQDKRRGADRHSRPDHGSRGKNPSDRAPRGKTVQGKSFQGKPARDLSSSGEGEVAQNRGRENNPESRNRGAGGRGEPGVHDRRGKKHGEGFSRQEGDGQEPVYGLRNYFSRPQKMRERYGRFPQSLSQTEEQSSRRFSERKKQFRATSPETARGEDSHRSFTDANPSRPKPTRPKPPRAKQLSRGQASRNEKKERFRRDIMKNQMKTTGERNAAGGAKDSNKGRESGKIRDNRGHGEGETNVRGES